MVTIYEGDEPMEDIVHDKPQSSIVGHEDSISQITSQSFPTGLTAIPASEVAVERLFSDGRDLLGLRRHSMESGTMRSLLYSQITIQEELNGNFVLFISIYLFVLYVCISSR
ncbi:hypothetical protein POJ06DRAFT_302743 [Lipomyces tetrasporus]|uniref:HAT C-terminal dimerisation domain-containing protein n=1 Tax=Lipomyces tetrasporus TaxID=54092 RepID=A0AAD7VR66_9ASCO|nr:uncharacterized protein POJ06DRAFT_302743 [Lipomyces tetrasporus]KAJ8098873.1 hypothetical protein POJ06DRAFT_302743 [Lipomyces tetrasporus]